MNIIEQLTNLDIEYEVTTFSDQVFTAEAVAKELGMALRQIAKAMVVKVSNTSFGIAVVPGDKRLNVTTISNFTGTNVRIAKRNEIPGAVGLPVGAVTPLITLERPAILIFFDRSLLQLEKINISSGDLSIGITLSPNDVVRVTRAKVLDLSE